MRRSVVGLAALLLAGLLGAGALFGPGPGVAPAPVAGAECMPAGRACRASAGGLELALEVAPDPRPLAPFAVEVRTGGEAASRLQAVTVAFTMPGMPMGVNRVELAQEGERAWRGEATLPVCRSGRRDWVVTVRAAGDRPYQAGFRLELGAVR